MPYMAYLKLNSIYMCVQFFSLIILDTEYGKYHQGTSIWHYELGNQ